MTTSIFPADKTKPFVAENGVTYVWEADRWRVKEYKLDDAALGKYLPLTGGTLTGKVVFKKEREDVNSVALSVLGRVRDNNNDLIKDVLFKAYQREESSPQADYIAYYGNGGGSTEILNRKTAQAEFASSQVVSDALIVQSAIQETNQIQDDQINLLETQVQLLAKVQIAGKWNYERQVSSNSPRPPKTGTFYGVHKDGATNVLLNWADVRLLMISKTDLEGGVYSFTQFEEGDKAEIIASDGSSAVYGTVTNNPNNDSYGNLIIEVERSKGGPFELKEFIISVYRPGANGGDVDLDILDQRYATIQHVDEGLAEKLSKTGSNDLATDTNWKIRQLASTGGNKTLIQGKDGQLGLYNLKEPIEPHHAATKSYVDNNGGAGGFNINLWTYRGAKNNGNGLNDGEFGSKKMAGNVIELYLSNKNSRGVIYHPTKPNSTAEFSHQITNSGQGGSPMTVMHQDGRCLWYAETKKLVFNRGTDGYVMIEAIKYTAQFDLLVEGEQYMLNVAGFLSPVSGW